MSMDCKTDIMDSSKGEGKRLLRTLELKAFRCVVDALRAQGSFTSRKCGVLKNLASTLKVGDERCRSEMRRAVNDNLLNYIAQCSEEQNSDENWRLESARKVARVPKVNEPTVFTALADKVSDWVLSYNRTLVEHDASLVDMIESKKCRTDANASRYHTAKLFRPLLTTSSRDAEQIALELEKIKSHSTLSRNKIPSAEEDSLTVPKPNEIPLRVETPKISVTLPESTPFREHLDVESFCNEVIVNSCPLQEPIEIQNIVVPNKTRAAKSRSRSRQKRSQPVKTSSLQEELSRTVSAVNALVTPVIESSGADKRPYDNSLNTATDEWQPKGKKSKTEFSSKVQSGDEVGKIIAIRIDEMKSSVVLGPGDKSSSICNSMVDPPQETVSSSHKSSVKCTEENSELPSEKDFTPHTFNLIPASRRLKMVKKKENSNGSLLAKEQELVILTDDRKMQNASPLTIVKSKFPEKKKSANQNKASNVPLVNDSLSSSSAVVKNGKVSAKEPPSKKKKETDENLKPVLPVLGQTKKTLSLLGNIKVCNLNAKAGYESPADPLSSNKNKANAEMEVVEEDEFEESELDQSDIDSGSEEYSSFDDSDSHSVIEYWDHEDDEDIIENCNNLDCDNEGFEKDDRSKYEVVDDDVPRSNQGVLSDEVSSNFESGDETIVEEIFDDEEFLSDVVDGCESGDSDKLELDNKDSTNSSSSDGEENCDKIEKTIAAEQPTIRTLLPKVTASNASVLRSSTLIPNSSAINVLNSQKSTNNMDTGPLTKIGPSVSGATVSILKLRKPLADGTTAELAKAKEVVIVSPKLQKMLSVNGKNEQSPSATPKHQVIPAAQCIVGGQTISLTNARLIRAAPKTNRTTVVTGEVTSELPKVTLYSSAEVPTSGGPQSSSASESVTLPQGTKRTNTTTSSVKPPVFVPKRVRRLYHMWTE